MTLEDIKDGISKLSAADRDQVRAYIDLLESNSREGFDTLSEDIWKEIERREETHASGDMITVPAMDVLLRLQDQR